MLVQDTQVLQGIDEKLDLRDLYEILESQAYLEHQESLVIQSFQEKKASRPTSTTSHRHQWPSEESW